MMKGNFTENFNRSLYDLFYFEQQIRDYTRIASKTNKDGKTIVTKSLINHFATNREKYILKTDIIKSGMVDYYLIIGTRKVNAWRILQRSEKITEARSMNKYNKTEFLSCLASIEWMQVFSDLNFDPNRMTDAFHEIFETTLNSHAPIRKCKVRTEQTPWLNPSIKSLMRERDKTKQLALKDGSLWAKYKKLRNRVTRAMREAVKEYYAKQIIGNQNNPSKMWKTINVVLGKTTRSTSAPLVEHEGKQITDKEEIVSAFNEHFINVGHSLASKIEVKSKDDPTQYLIDIETSARFRFKSVKHWVLTALKGLKESKSSGPDKIPAKVLKDAAELNCVPLAIIFNESLWRGVFPEKWKLARVTPILKSGKQSEMNNYRPISVLSGVSRLLEKVVHDQLFEFLTANNLLSKNQFAYRKLHSTITSLMNVTDTWYKNIDEKKINISLFLDLSKAFDTINHEILLTKLGKYGINQNELSWFTSYLTGRKQYCCLGGKNSKGKEVTCGIPQGSCLGPLLFILYTNDFEKSLSTFNPNMYADDTSISSSSENPLQLLEDLKGS